MSTSPFVALINNDVVLDDDWLATVRGAMRDEQLAAVQTILRRDADDDRRRRHRHQRRHDSGRSATAFDRHAARGAWGVSATAALYRVAAARRSRVRRALLRLLRGRRALGAPAREGWRRRSSCRSQGDASRLADRLRSSARDAVRLRTRNRYCVARMHRGVGRIAALLWEDVRLLLRGRSSLRGMIEGLCSNVVVATPDVVGERMAGPGIRALYFARELAKHLPTRLVAASDRRDRE